MKRIALFFLILLVVLVVAYGLFRYRVTFDSPPVPASSYELQERIEHHANYYSIGNNWLMRDTSTGVWFTYFEGDARLFLQRCGAESFDIVINDLFTEQDSPPFIHSNGFLRAALRCLKHQGVYLANTITDTFEFTHGTAIEKIGYDVERFPRKKEGISNIIYEVLKD